MTTANKPARTFKEVTAFLEGALADYPACGDYGVLTVFATFSVANDWMAEDDGDPTTEFGERFSVCTLPLGAASVNAQGEAVYSLKFEYSYNYSDGDVDPYAPDSDYDR